MALPKVDLPKFSHTLVGLNKKVEFRPFTVKEQKIFLLAKESKDPKQQVNAIKQVIGLCCFESIDPNELPFFDIEDLFIRIRERSVSDQVKITYQVRGEDGELTGEKILVEIDLKDIVVTFPEGHEKQFMVSENVGIKMKYPTLSMLVDDPGEFEMIKNCIDTVFTEEDTFSLSEESEEEVNDFIESLGTDAIRKIKKFFDTMPRIRYQTKVKLKSGEEKTIKLEGLSDFFG